jgi:hypothetical protein
MNDTFYKKMNNKFIHYNVYKGLHTYNITNLCVVFLLFLIMTQYLWI